MAKYTFCSPFTVVLPRNPETIVATAASELSVFLKKITGKTVNTVTESEFSGGPAFFICVASAAPQEYNPALLGNEGTYYAIGAEGVFFGGGSVRGPLYSVYTFLEDELGVRRYTETVEKVPQAECFALEEKICSYVPPMHYRAASFHDCEAPAYTVFNKLNARTPIPAEFGGAEDFGIGFVHTIHTLVPESLFETHPEYFPLSDGKRVHGPHTQRCLTNPDVLKLTVDAVLADFRAHPNHRVASVSQADTDVDSSICQCPACRRINEKEGSTMGTQLYFVNAVAEAIEKEFPERYIETLAYRFTRSVCKEAKPRDNVIVRLCSIECCFSHPIDTCNYTEQAAVQPVGNPPFVKDMQDWAAVSKNLYIWDYVTNYAHYLAPHPNLYVLKPNMKFFADHATVGIFPEGAPDARGAELSELKSWLLAKLEWNPDFDVESGIREFVQAYAGAGAEPILRYIDRLNRRPALTGTHFRCYTAPDRAFFTPEFMALAEADFAEAKAAVSDEETLKRIRRWEMSVRYVRIVLYSDTFGPEGPEAEISRFLADMPALGISQICEGGTYATSGNDLRNRIQYK